ncbi:MAG: YdbH domain-containing protein [Proteobacteria bacterium]|nr:YdbH domain-containing protein [Pseudomonadota bacterium]MBU4296870.1 YdbH domain-containing protein [Pseudomonadota bacterium]MCG2746508.1 YdbH domain-containing protein [Desulfobulbaceae bacterium]
MTTRTRIFLRRIIIIALLPVIGWAAITTLLPVYLQHSLLPSLAARAGIDSFHVQHLFINLTEAGAGFAIGQEESPDIAVSELTASYHPVALLAGKVDELTLSGVEIHCAVSDNRIIFTDPGLQKLFNSPSPAKDKGGAADTVQLPLAIKRVAIRRSALICRLADRVIRLPFAADAALAANGNASGPLQVHLQLFPAEQEIAITADLDLHQQQAHLAFSAANLRPRQFADLLNLPAGLQLDTWADFSGSADIGLSPLVFSSGKGRLTLHNSALRFQDTTLSPKQLPQQEPLPITIIFSGSQQDIAQPLLFTVNGALPDLVAALKGTVLSLPAPSFTIKGSATAEAISIDADVHLSLSAENADLSLKLPAIALQAAGRRQGKEGWQVQGDLTVNNALFDHHSSGTRAAGGSLTLPLSWPPADGNAKGKLALTKITWQKKDIGALAGTIQLQENKLNLSADFHSPLLQGVTASLSLSSDISGESGRSELALTIPPSRLTNFSPAKIFPQAKDITFSGLISGEAQMSLADGQLTGNGRLSLKKGSLELAEQKITVSGIDTTLTLPFLPQLRSAPNQQLNFSSARLGELAIDGGTLHFTVESNSSFLLEKGIFNWADGSVNTYALRFSENHLQPEMIFYCTQLKLARILEQVGIKNVEGDGTVNGRIPVSLTDGKITFAPSYLYSTPGEGGVIRIAGGDFLTQAIPLDSPQFGQLDFAQEALRNFSYNWAKVHLFSENDTLVMQLNLDGKPASPLPFAYDSATGGLQRTHVQGAQGISQPILLDVNFRFPLNTFLDYDKNLKDLLQRAR